MKIGGVRAAVNWTAYLSNLFTTGRNRRSYVIDIASHSDTYTQPGKMEH